MSRFSLIVATIERTEPLEKLLASLALQTFSDFEVVIVDQNRDDRVEVTARRWSRKMTIRHLRSEMGLSRARNRGIKEETGEIIAFPDDDCWYGADVLLKIHEWFLSHPEFDFLSTCARDEKFQLCANRWPTMPSRITRTNVLRTAISISLFFRKEVIQAVGGFDEFLGLGSGSKFGSGEESDFVFRALSLGYLGWFENSIAIFHPARKADGIHVARARSFGLGFGYVLRRHRVPFWISLYLCTRPAAGWLINYVRRRPVSSEYLATLRGRLAGYLNLSSI